MQTCRTVIIDDHQLFRKSLILFISTLPGHKVVFEGGDGNSLLSFLESHQADLVLLDLNMPGMNGFKTCAILRKKYPDLKVLIVSEIMHSEDIIKIMEIGAHGYLSKHASIEQLQLAIESVLEHDFYFDPFLQQTVRRLFGNQTKDTVSAPANFSVRELQIIELACADYTSAQIADRLFINVQTVDTHRKRLIKKLGKKSFLGVVVFAIKNGLVKF